ncbi:tetraspanin-9-like [Centruroides vittatus]|uniref:tetraspanin-9-like n=1 Tax=Centruroides vittatus TaxID=120091 RepID=UPI00350EEA6C
MGSLRTCARHCVCFLAFITWLLGCGVIGFMMWILATSSTVGMFFTGALIFTYVVLGFGTLIFIGGLIGWIGSYRKGGCLMKFFLLLSVLTIACEIGGIVALYIMNVKLVKVLGIAWNEVNQDARNVLQKEFACCGFLGPEDYSPESTPIDKSCYKPIMKEEDILEEPELYKEGCRDKMMDWMSKNKTIWVACLGSILAVQVVCVLLTVYVVSHSKRERRSSINSLDTSHSHTYL